MFFITYRLSGSLPQEVIEQLKLERVLKNKEVANKDIQNRLDFRSNTLFQKFDFLLDNPTSGPLWLKDENVAKIISDSIHHLDSKNYKLIAFSIMPNHVHLILYKINKPLFRILQSLKRYTAYEANRFLKRDGAFWQKESYDNLVRDEGDLSNKLNYVLNNPVKAGIVNDWREHKFTFCKEEFLMFVN